MAIQWMTVSGAYINESASGGLEWMAFDFINEQPEAPAGIGTSDSGIGLSVMDRIRRRRRRRWGG